METYQNYKGFGITYHTFCGLTEIDYYGRLVKRFPYLGEYKGEIAAKKYIDENSHKFLLKTL